jgi:hypothetical protein
MSRSRFTTTTQRFFPQNVRVGMDGYFRTRKLDARKHGIVDTVLAHAKRAGLFEAAKGQSTRTRLSRRACWPAPHSSGTDEQVFGEK